MTKLMLRDALIGLMIISASLFAVSAQAATDTANASATILTPIAISKAADLGFGDVYPDGAAAGTVSIAADGTRSAGGAASLGPTGGSAASFNVTGQASATYVISLPAAAVTLTSGANTMTVDTFNTDGTGTLDGTGAETINVGATLNVSAGQAAGTYTGTFDVSVDYN